MRALWDVLFCELFHQRYHRILHLSKHRYHCSKATCRAERLHLAA